MALVHLWPDLPVPGSTGPDSGLPTGQMPERNSCKKEVLVWLTASKVAVQSCSTPLFLGLRYDRVTEEVFCVTEEAS